MDRFEGAFRSIDQLIRMVQTPKVSPLCNRGVRAFSEYPRTQVLPIDAPQRVCPINKTKCWGTPSGCTYMILYPHSGGIRCAQTARLLSGDAFSVITKQISMLK